MKKTNNKGFSLVELIIVIAIMAILIGVLAPQYIKYVEKSRVSADKDLLDSVYQACTIAASDPEVTNAPTSTTSNVPDLIKSGNSTSDWGNVVYNTLGTNIAGVKAKLKSKASGGSSATISITVGANGDFTVSAGIITVPEVVSSSN